MPITTLDPTTALVVIDLQHGLLAMPTVQPIAEVIARAASLARAFRTRGLPVALVNVAGGATGRSDSPRPAFTPPANWTELVPELDQQPTDILATKVTWGAFSGTALDIQLRRRGVTQLVLCGVATSVGVESTARQGHELAYHITLATDAMTDLNADAHTNSITRIFPKLGETGTTQEILDELNRPSQR